MTAKRTCSRFLTVLMAILCLSACAQKAPALSDASDKEESDVLTTPEETTSDELKLAKTDFDGAKLRILGMGPNYGVGYYETTDIWVAEQTGESFNDAIYDRNLACEENYDFTVEFTQDANVMGTIGSAVASGLDICDLFFENWKNAYGMSKQAYMLDLFEIDTMDLSNPWWDQNATRDLAMGNRLFYTTGELTTLDDKCTRFVYFNKKLVEDYNLANPYQLVADNNWTLDTWTEMARGVRADLDGDGVIGPHDRYGFFTETGQIQMFLLGFDMKYVEYDKDGVPQYSFLQNSEDYTKLEKLVTMLNDRELNYHVNAIGTVEGYTNRWASGRGLFAQDKMLFTISGALVITEFRDMESEFGILPMPKYDSTQETYCHTMDTYSPLFAVPNTKKDTKDLGMMLEYYSYEGMNILTPVFREKLLERKYTRDAESVDMLAIVFDNKSFDITHVANFGGVTAVATNAIERATMPRISDYKEIQEKILNAIQDDYESIINSGK
ncbi:MAG: hypothetical protein ACI3XP_02665 [Eubacteriales bacterium]